MHQNELPFSECIYIIICWLTIWHHTNRNQAYHARIQLAVLDHNNHIDRQEAQNRDGGVIYARKFRKQTKKWDATPLMKSKEYKYIPLLLKEIEGQRSTAFSGTKRKRLLPSNHPTRIRSTIGNTAPEPTDSIVQAKKSRFKWFDYSHTFHIMK